MAKKKESKPVALIEDPFGLNNLEVSQAQNDSGELDLDEDLKDLEIEETAPETFEKLGKAVAESDAAYAEEASKQIVKGLSEEDAAKELARQIAEDEALEKAMKEEADEAEKNDPELRAALPNSENLDLAEVQSCIEALLFMVDKPISVEKLRELLGPNFTHAIFQEAVTELVDRYKNPHHGIELVKVAGGYQFRTKPGRAPLARKLAKIQTQKLSSGAMETLAIIAYKQPVLKEDVDKIRGVDSSHFIRGLLEKDLIKISGRSELPGRPMEYATTHRFLEVFGLPDLQSMPPLRELENMVPASQAKGEEDPRIKKLRELVGEMNLDTSITLQYDPKEDEKLLQEIRERVGSIPTSTPYLEAQKAAEKGEAAAPAEASAAELIAAQMVLETAAATAAETAPETVTLPEA